MKILDAKIRNYSEFDNLPTLEVLVDKIPDRDSLVYDQKGSFYFAEKDGYVSFFHYSRPGEGYGGRKFTINVNGKQKYLIGPWSSNSVSMEQAGFQRTANVSLTDDPKVMEKGYTFYGANLTFEKFEEACKIANGLVGQDRHGFLHPMPRCEDCGNHNTQKYRTLHDEGKKYPKIIRKILCEKCAMGYNLREDKISSEVNYEIKDLKRSINNECLNVQLQVFG